MENNRNILVMDEDVESFDEFGALCKRDVPLKILTIRKKENSIDYLVEWQVRENGIKPKNSVVKGQDLRGNHLTHILDQLEQYIDFENE